MLSLAFYTGNASCSELGHLVWLGSLGSYSMFSLVALKKVMVVDSLSLE